MMPFASDDMLEDYAIDTFLRGKFRGTKLSIPLTLADIKALSTSYAPKMYLGYLGENKVQCSIACGHLANLKITPAELKAGKVNILDHLKELLPTTGSKIGIVTYQNGIQNTPDDFLIMGQKIVEKIKLFGGSTLCIGIYNTSWGLTNDLARVTNSVEGKDSESIWQARQLFATLSTLLPQVNSSVLWTHVAHSEGGLIAKMALSRLEVEEKSKVKKHLICATYGPAAPVPKASAKITYNTYSEKDGVTGHYGRIYLSSQKNVPEHKREYNIKFVPSLIPDKSLPTWVYFWQPHIAFGYKIFHAGKKLLADHNFAGTTYQQVLEDNFRTMAKFGFYNAKAR